jgi:DNA-directed RNA polymerase specialized sigma24 family protein
MRQRNEIEISSRLFLASSGTERERIFREDIYPFLEEMISGVFLSLRLYDLSQDDIRDIKQEIYLKIVSRIQGSGGRGIRSMKNYYFISIKNITIDYLRSRNRDRKFSEHLKELILTSRYVKRKINRTGETDPDNMQ